MKLNEFKVKKQVNELDMSDLIGDLGAAKLKSGLGKLAGGASGQMKSTDIAARDRFIKDFVGNTASELANAISSGIVTVGAAGGTPPSGPPPGRPPGAGGGTPPTPPTGGAQGATPPTKPGQPAPPTKPGQPAPPTQPSATPAPPAQATTPAQPTQPTQPTAVKKHVPFSQKIAPQLQNKVLRTQAATKFKESSYDKLNAIFESIMRLDEAMSVTDFIKNKVTNYMKGTPNLDKYAPDIERLAAEVGKAYGQGGKAGNAAIMAPLQKIGGMMHTIINTEMGDAQGAGAAQGATADATAGAEQGATAAATTANTGKMKALKQAISKMKKRDRDSLLSYLTQITPAQATAPTATTPTTTPVATATPKPKVKKAVATPGAGAGAFAGIARDLTGQPNPAISTSKSGTGGTITKMPMVTKHQASPVNPNIKANLPVDPSQAANIQAKQSIAAKARRKVPAKA